MALASSALDLQDLPQWRKFLTRVGNFLTRVLARILGKALHFFLSIFVSPFLRVRVGSLNAKGKISILIMYVEPWLRLQNMQRAPRERLVVINPGRDPNEQLSAMYGRHVLLLDDRKPLRRELALFGRKLLVAAGSPFAIELYEGLTSSYAQAWTEGEPALTFTEKEHARGQRVLDEIGVGREKFICFGIRDPAYYDPFKTSEARQRFVNPEDDEDTFIRNPRLVNYLPTVQALAEKGLFAVRMGQVSSAAVPPGFHPRVIDYSRQQRTPFGDVYLLAHAQFTVTGGAGIWCVSTTFNRPVVHCESMVLWGGWYRPGDLFIPMKIWIIAEKRFMNFTEMIRVDTRYTYQSQCQRDGMELIHNTPEEILAVSLEMKQRLDGTWISSPEDEELQKRFRKLYPEGHGGLRSAGQMGAAFLRAHADLL